MSAMDRGPMGKTCAVIPAAGRGIRMGGDRPKQFLRVSRKPILLHTLDAVSEARFISEIFLVAPADYQGEAKALLKARRTGSGVNPSPSGCTGTGSSANASAGTITDSGPPSCHAHSGAIVGESSGDATRGAVFEGPAITVVAGVRTPAGDLPGRIKAILDGIAEVIATYRPDQAAVEQVFVNVNPASTLLLGQARGAAIAALVLANQPVAEYTALQVKQAVVGNGHAGKDQVSHMVQRLLRLNGVPQSDAADALAVALTHAQHDSGAMKQLASRGLSIKRGRLA